MPKLIHPDGGEVFASVAGAAVLRNRGYVDPGDPFERPDPTANRPVWDAYARSLGMDPTAYPSKAKLIEALPAL